MSAHIKEILPHLLGMHEGWQKTLLVQWPTIIGPLKDKVILEKIESDTITLGVFHPAWVQELSFLKPVLLQAINDHLDQPYIKQIKIKTCAAPKKRYPAHKEAEHTTLTTHTLSAQESHALDALKDLELKKALRLFLQRCIRK